ncbi:hypothetical protein Y88_1655 [Novosphingobium nitrogenifigens DSM 19370]|uniref:Uncharacterized protein n=1 Tax=Novosphingobium nitrogenifigens DSM 19370 TaxID=983920 RepID=F1Z3N7_9SPHN|nr:hypothetical protein Y88_1655 [Novosphingobium nitrogenifigens DSM 19370]
MSSLADACVTEACDLRGGEPGEIGTGVGKRDVVGAREADRTESQILRNGGGECVIGGDDRRHPIGGRIGESDADRDAILLPVSDRVTDDE